MTTKYKLHCIYCGNKNSITRDHVIPRSWSGNQSFLDSDFNPMVPACKECNNNLSNRPCHDLQSRVDFLINQYEKKWAKVLNLPDWTEEEIEDLGPSLRKSLESSLKEKKTKQQRLKNLYKFKTNTIYDYI